MNKSILDRKDMNMIIIIRNNNLLIGVDDKRIDYYPNNIHQIEVLLVSILKSQMNIDSVNLDIIKHEQYIDNTLMLTLKLVFLKMIKPENLLVTTGNDVQSEEEEEILLCSCEQKEDLKVKESHEDKPQEILLYECDKQPLVSPLLNDYKKENEANRDIDSCDNKKEKDTDKPESSSSSTSTDLVNTELLNKMVTDEYIAISEEEMKKHFRDKTALMLVRHSDKHIIPELTSIWKKRGITMEILLQSIKESNRFLCLKLEWV